MVTTEQIAAGDPEALALVEAMVAEIDALYGIDMRSGPSGSVEDFSPPHGAFVVVREDGRAVAGGGVKRLGTGVAEIKRMYVVPDARSRGHARRLLEGLEAAAADLGYWIARLDTGPEQPHARALYESAGYREIGNFNANPFAAWWGERDLPAVVGARYNGPPASGHGGYSAWVAARYLDAPAVRVALRAPPPLEAPMDVVRDGGAVELHARDRGCGSSDATTSISPAGGRPAAAQGTDSLVLRAEAGDLGGVEPPAPLDAAAAHAARAPALWAPDVHPFPTCFVCGPLHPDGLHVYAGPVGDGRFAADWTPPEGCDASMVWAAMDCPSWAPFMADREGSSVLASFTVQVHSLPPAAPHAIVAEALAIDGRKRTSVVGVYSDAGELRAVARALWIELRG